MTQGLSFLGRSPLPSTTRPASLPTVLGPQQAVGERPVGKPCAVPWPTMPRSVPSSISTWAGGSQASAVGLVPGTPCRTPDLPTLQNRNRLTAALRPPLPERWASSQAPSLRAAGKGWGSGGGLAGGGEPSDLTAHWCAHRASVPRGPALLRLCLGLPTQLLSSGGSRGGVLPGSVRERLRVPARPLLGRRPLCSCCPLPLLPPAPALRSRGHRSPAVQPVVGPRASLALGLGLEAAWSPRSPPLCYLLNLPPLLGAPHMGPVTSHGIIDGPAQRPSQ